MIRTDDKCERVNWSFKGSLLRRLLKACEATGEKPSQYVKRLLMQHLPPDTKNTREGW